MSQPRLNVRTGKTLAVPQLVGLQIPPLLKAGYRVIAPDLRGALGGDSYSPQEPEAYDIEKELVKDVAGESRLVHQALLIQCTRGMKLWEMLGAYACLWLLSMRLHNHVLTAICVKYACQYC